MIENNSSKQAEKKCVTYKRGKIRIVADLSLEVMEVREIDAGFFIC